jgi:hypothetical protein
MAQDKKSFVAYADWTEIFKMLSDEEAGRLIKHLFSYVNDENPVLEDRFLMMAFEPIKLQLKRDLQKYEAVRERRAEAGRKGGVKSGETRKQTEANEANASFVKQTEANEAVNVTVTVNDNVNDTVTDILLEKETKGKSFNYKNELLLLVGDENKKLVEDYISLRKTKKASLSETALNILKKECETNNYNIRDALTECIANNWQGFKVQWVTSKQLSDGNGKSINNAGSGTNSSQGYKPAAVDSEKLIREITSDFENGNIPGQY